MSKGGTSLLRLEHLSLSRRSQILGLGHPLLGIKEQGLVLVSVSLGVLTLLEELGNMHFLSLQCLVLSRKFLLRYSKVPSGFFKVSVKLVVFLNLGLMSVETLRDDDNMLCLLEDENREVRHKG